MQIGNVIVIKSNKHKGEADDRVEVGDRVRTELKENKKQNNIAENVTHESLVRSRSHCQ